MQNAVRIYPLIIRYDREEIKILNICRVLLRDFRSTLPL